MNKLKIATWNVNSIRIRLNSLQKLCEVANPDIVCIQEVKAKDEDFPYDDIKKMGFEHIAVYGQPSYNGVAILSKIPLKNVKKIDWVGKSDARHIQATVLDDIEINCMYMPAGGDIPDPIENLSFAHKLAFFDDMSDFFEQNFDKISKRKMIMLGDFNVAPTEFDVWNHKLLLKEVSHTPIEMERMERLLKSLDFVNAVRKIYPYPQKVYSWWSYRNPNWQTNDKGRLLDHIWTTQTLFDEIEGIDILKEIRACERPSDHVPVMMTLKV